jgi:hypothetical protein
VRGGGKAVSGTVIKAPVRRHNMKKETEVFLRSVIEPWFGKELEQATAEFLCGQLLRGAEAGGELDEVEEEEWLARLSFQLVWLDSADYTRALVRAIWLAPRFAATDFGTSRQRDLAQVWTDTARGFLGEIGVQRFLQVRFGIDCKLTTRRGELEEFLPSDIEKIRKPEDTAFKEPRLTVSIKTGKFNARWLDLPGAQFGHSDVYSFVKLGIARTHFLSFLKNISFIRDKLIPKAQELRELDDQDAQELWDELPDFEPIPAYIAGFLERASLHLPIHEVTARRRGRKHLRVEISGGVGLFTRSNVQEYIEELDPEGVLRVTVDPIIESLTESAHFLANSGALTFGPENWASLVERL